MKKAQIPYLSLLAAFCVIFLSGCQSPVFQNYVEESIPRNASSIYTFSFAANISEANINVDTLEASIVIDAKTHQMTKVPGKNRIFTFDYKIPQGVDQFRYYYVIEYDYNNNGVRGHKVRYSTHDNYGRDYTAKIIDKYGIQIVSNRGHVGDKIPLVGSGFSNLDTITVGGVPSETTIHSANSLDFIVPALTAGQTYDVVLQTEAGEVNMGTFQVDQGELTVTPENISVASGDVVQVIFQISGTAPAGGFPVSVTTDIPTSVIMPEVGIAAGSNQATVIIEGGEPGSGFLYVEATGYPIRQIPISVY